jgi:ProP effector
VGIMSARDIERAKIAIATIELLSQQWAKTFFIYQRRRLPLAIGIRNALLAALDGAVSADELKLAMRRYTNSVGYLCACREGVVRVDLNGDAVGVVSADEAKRGVERLAAIKLRQQKIKAAAPNIASVAVEAKVAVSVEAVAVATAPKRLSLSDLKAAALRRKTSTPVSADAEVL